MKNGLPVCVFYVTSMTMGSTVDCMLGRFAGCVAECDNDCMLDCVVDDPSRFVAECDDDSCCDSMFDEGMPETVVDDPSRFFAECDDDSCCNSMFDRAAVNRFLAECDELGVECMLLESVADCVAGCDDALCMLENVADRDDAVNLTLKTDLLK